MKFQHALRLEIRLLNRIGIRVRCYFKQLHPIPLPTSQNNQLLKHGGTREVKKCPVCCLISVDEVQKEAESSVQQTIDCNEAVILKSEMSHLVFSPFGNSHCDAENQLANQDIAQGTLIKRLFYLTYFYFYFFSYFIV